MARTEDWPTHVHHGSSHHSPHHSVVAKCQILGLDIPSLAPWTSAHYRPHLFHSVPSVSYHPIIHVERGVTVSWLKHQQGTYCWQLHWPCLVHPLQKATAAVGGDTASHYRQLAAAATTDGDDSCFEEGQFKK
jgi:hypothetical protein